MTFADIIDTLAKELETTIEVEDNICAVLAGGSNKSSATILIQGFDERKALLMTADLGQPPPERLERLYRALLEANDLFRDTAGATLSVDAATGNVRLQRFDAYDAVSEAGPRRALIAFASVASAWRGIVSDFRDAPDESKKEAPPQDLSNLSGFRV